MFLSSLLPTFALATGLVFAAPSGQNVRIEVMHFGNSAVKADIVALGKDNKPVEVVAFPKRVTVSKGNSRKVFVKVDENVYRVCSSTLASRGAQSIRLQSCVKVRDIATGEVIRPNASNSSAGNLMQRLRDGLNQTGVRLL